MKAIIILVISLAFIGCDKSPAVGRQQKIKSVLTALLDGTRQDVPSVEEIEGWGIDGFNAITIKGVLDGAKYQRDVNLALNDQELAPYAKVVLTTDDNGALLFRNIVHVGSYRYDFPRIPLNIKEQAKTLRGFWLDLVKNPKDPSIIVTCTLDTITLSKTGPKNIGGRLVPAVEEKVEFQAKKLHLLPNGDAGIKKTANH